MEKEGLQRALTYIISLGFSIREIVTDRHPQIQKWLRETHPAIKHYYDIWHVAKS
jgi:hypothetical protein